jgi:hypothetical protein
MTRSWDLIFVDSARDRVVAILDTTLIVLTASGVAPPASVAIDSRALAACEYNARKTLLGLESGELVTMADSGETEKVPNIVFPGPIVALTKAQFEDGGSNKAGFAVGYVKDAGRFYVALLEIDSGPEGSINRTAIRLPIQIDARPTRLEFDTNTLLIVMEHGIDIVDTAHGLSLLSAEGQLLLESVGSSGTPVRIAAASLSARRIALFTSDPRRLEIRRLERLYLDTTEHRSTDFATREVAA